MKKTENKNTNNVTELVFILDKSGSMAPLRDDTIGGFNTMIEQQKKGGGDVLVSTVMFSDEQTIVHDRCEIGSIKPRTQDDYAPMGCTALLDAVGDSINHIENIHKYARKEDVPQKTMFVITTDGMENASVKYTASKVKKLIEKHREAGWEFLFIGANIDSVETASSIGIDARRAVNYTASAEGTRKLFRGVARAVAEVKDCACPNMMSDDWKSDID